MYQLFPKIYHEMCYPLIRAIVLLPVADEDVVFVALKD